MPLGSTLLTCDPQLQSRYSVSLTMGLSRIVHRGVGESEHLCCWLHPYFCCFGHWNLAIFTGFANHVCSFVEELGCFFTHKSWSLCNLRKLEASSFIQIISFQANFGHISKTGGYLSARLMQIYTQQACRVVHCSWFVCIVERCTCSGTLIEKIVRNVQTRWEER